MVSLPANPRPDPSALNLSLCEPVYPLTFVNLSNTDPLPPVFEVEKLEVVGLAAVVGFEATAVAGLLKLDLDPFKEPVDLETFEFEFNDLVLEHLDVWVVGILSPIVPN